MSFVGSFCALSGTPGKTWSCFKAVQHRRKRYGLKKGFLNMVIELGHVVHDANDAMPATWSLSQFRRWIHMRIGMDGRPVYVILSLALPSWVFGSNETGSISHRHWYAVGDVFSSTGELLFRIEGLDLAKSMKISDREYRSLSRKIFVFRDVETNEPIDNFRGRELAPLAYPYQSFHFTLNERGAMNSRTTMGSGEGIRTLASQHLYWRELGDSWVVSTPVFTERGWCEKYNFFDHSSTSNLRHPFQVYIRYFSLCLPLQ